MQNWIFVKKTFGPILNWGNVMDTHPCPVCKSMHRVPVKFPTVVCNNCQIKYPVVDGIINGKPCSIQVVRFGYFLTSP